MLKIIKYDLKSMGVVAGVIAIVTIIINIVFCSLATSAEIVTNISNSVDYPLSVLIYQALQANLYLYIVLVIAVIFNMWRKVVKDTELFEIAGVSPLKVGAARMVLVFIIVTLFAILITVADSLLCHIYTQRISEYIAGGGTHYSSGITNDISIYSSMFAINGLNWTNYFTPVFAGLYAAILFTTSFLFVTINHRFNNMFFSAVVLFSLIILVLMLNFMVLHNINYLIPELNLNTIGIAGVLIERFDAGYYYRDIKYLINPNMLNMGLLIFQTIYVSLMFSVYSIRRKALCH